jgi:transglutaminase-like putative cysteine protease
MGRLTLGLAHELGLMAAMSTALLMVLLGGEFPPLFWIAALAPVLSMALSRRGIVVPGVSGTLLGIGAIGAAVVQVLRGGVDAAVFAGGTAILGLTVARLITRRTLAHDQQALLLSLVLVFAGSVLNVGVSYFVGFVAYAICAVWAMSTRQLLAGAEQAGMSVRQTRARDDVITPLFFAASAAVSLAVLAASLVIFVSFPRVGFGELGFLGRKDSQLPGTVGFGSDPRGLSTSTAVVARLRGVPEERFDQGLYLRGVVYDVVTYDAFSQSTPVTERAPITDSRPGLRQLAQSTPDLGYEIMQWPVAGSILFTLGRTRSALALSGGSANPNRGAGIAGVDRHDQLRSSSPLASPMRVQLFGSIPTASMTTTVAREPPTLSDRDRARYLALPPPDPRVEVARAEMLKGTDDDADTPARVAAVRAHLLGTFAYSLDGAVTGRERPLLAFLLEEKAGHCELFAGAFALLLRSMDIPARVVGGFQGGVWTEDDAVVFQARHAHAWVEWWLDDVGWVVDDATPAATAPRERLGGLDGLVERLRVFWDDRVVDYSLGDQQDAMRKVSKALRGKHLGTFLRVAVVAAVLGVVLVIALRRLRRRRRQVRQGDVLAEAIVSAWERLSEQRAPLTLTVGELVAQHPHPALVEAARDYERTRYGAVTLGADVVDGHLRALKRLRGPRDRVVEGAEKGP